MFHLLYIIENTDNFTAELCGLGLHIFVGMLIPRSGNCAEFPVIMQAIANCRPLTL